MATTPAQKLSDARDLVAEAIDQLCREGLDYDTLRYCGATYWDLNALIEKFPMIIRDNERRECAQCEHQDNDSTVGWLGCSAANEYRCPVVKRCGFRHPDDVAAIIPDFLKKQAY